jgi:DNA polymerase-3 subunit epsilon
MKQLYIDLETTGLEVQKARICQIGLIYLNKEKSILINPTIHIPQEASNIHKIYDEMVLNSPTFADISKPLYKLILDCDFVIGYNIRKYDWLILYIEFLRIGIELPHKPIIDVYEQVKLFEPTKKLKDVYLRYFNKQLENSHSALEDIIATKKVYEYLLKKLS